MSPPTLATASLTRRYFRPWGNHKTPRKNTTMFKILNLNTWLCKNRWTYHQWKSYFRRQRNLVSCTKATVLLPEQMSRKWTNLLFIYFVRSVRVKMCVATRRNCCFFQSSSVRREINSWKFADSLIATYFAWQSKLYFSMYAYFVLPFRWSTGD
jgi:hypothetical protein